MASSTRIKGVALFLEIDGTRYDMDVTACSITNEKADSDVQTFEDAAAGGARKFLLNITGVQSVATGSLWQYLWQNTGDEVPFAYAPHGNETPSVLQPHFEGTVKVGPKPTIGGEAGTGNTFTFETVWEIAGTPTQATT